MNKKSLVALAAAGALMLSGCGTGARSKTAMQIGDTKVTLGDINVLANDYINYGADFATAKKMMSEQIETMLKYEALGKALGKELSDDDKQQVVRMKAQTASQNGGLKAYKSFLKGAGSSIEFLDNFYSGYAYQSLLADELKVDDPTEDEVKKFFEENYYRAKHILIEKEPEATEEPAAEENTEENAEATEEATATPEATEAAGKVGMELAEELLEKAKAGEDFDAMIKEYGTDPGAESNPDGYIFTDGDMVTEFEECVKSLQPGEFAICETTYGYHVIERLPFGPTEEKYNEWFENAKSNAENACKTKKEEAKLDELLATNNITVTINQDVIDGFEEDASATPIPQQQNTGY